MGKLLAAGGLPISNGDNLWELSSINAVLIALLVVFAFQSLFSYARVYIFNYVTENALKQIRKETFGNIIKLPMSFFDKRQVGELNSRISSDIETLGATFTTTIAEFIRQIIIIIGGITIITIISWKLTLLVLVALPPMVAIAAIFGRFIKKLSKQTQQSIAESNVIVQESYSGITNVKSFSNETHEINRYDGTVTRVKDLAMKRTKWRAAFISFMILFMSSTIALVVWYGAVLQNKGDINNEQMDIFVMFAIFVGASFGSIPDLYSQLVKAVGATENLMDLLDEPAENISDNKTDIKINGSVSFKDVSFNYPSRPDIQVLRSISFTADPGEQIAIVGGSGAGKSTIVALILRYYDFNQGQITIDDKPIEHYELSDLRNQMAIVPQEVLLFGGSIRDNIEYGKPGASEEEIMEAARKANAHSFIEDFPEGYDTYVGDRGIQLSGGQKQRIAIARAILKDPSILILDEATSSLDSESEKLVQEALEKLMKNRTSFVIAHRMSTIRNADKILVMHKGSLVETGTHVELMHNLDGFYKRLHDFQSATETIEYD